jgi:uncharacterized membrane protein (UPF0127 family)
MSNSGESSIERALRPSELDRQSVVSAENLTRRRSLAHRVRLALTPLTRLRGLIAHPPLERGEGLLLRPCRGIHTWFMRYPIDVIFLDAEGRIVALAPNMRPWSMTPVHFEANCALELPAENLASGDTSLGDLVVFRLFVE